MTQIIDWPLAFAVVGVAITFFTFLLQHLKNRRETIDKEDYEDLVRKNSEMEKSLAVYQEQTKNIEDQMKRISEEQEKLDSKIINRIEKVDKKIDHFVDILIQFLTTKE